MRGQSSENQVHKLQNNMETQSHCPIFAAQKSIQHYCCDFHLLATSPVKKNLIALNSKVSKMDTWINQSKNIQKDIL